MSLLSTVGTASVGTTAGRTPVSDQQILLPEERGGRLRPDERQHDEAEGEYVAAPQASHRSLRVVRSQECVT